MNNHAAPRERPILFSAPMIRAILDGRKTMTRRMPSPTNSLANGSRWSAARFKALDFSQAWLDSGPSPAGNAGPYLQVPEIDDDDGRVHRVYPDYMPGDRLWVRETFNLDWCDHPIYRADGGSAVAAGYSHEPKWRPSIFMPRWASRIMLEITDVRCERLQDITAEDARREGVEPEPEGCYTMNPMGAYYKFRYAWDQINGKRATWDSNPWVWVILFEVIP